jgi:hypothetical protein
MASHRRHRIPSLDHIEDIDQAFDAAFSLLAFTMNRHLIDHMLRCGRQLTSNDYEALVLWGVLAHQNAAHLMPPGAMPSAHLNERGLVPFADQRLRPLKQSDLADITGIPRETVRRKLEWLAVRGFVERTDKGWVVSRGRLEPDLREFTRESAMRLLAVADEMRVILTDSDQHLKRQRAVTASI